MNTDTEGSCPTLFKKRITLDDMNGVAFQNRFDTKYIVSRGQIDEVLRRISFYFALEINHKIVHPYKNLYYDTKDFTLFRDHLRGKANRCKFRIRRYCTGSFFNETKRKTNKGKTVKKRFPSSAVSRMDTLFPDLDTFEQSSQLRPVILVGYDRLTCVSPDYSERITVDFNLSYHCQNRNRQYSGIVLLEVKKESASRYSYIKEILRNMRIFPHGFSKYCIGIASVYPDIRLNTLKHKLRIIEDITNGEWYGH
ncbi:MAG: polyphosphate polymerase domain-containing protein [Fibrobacterota bacterium]